MQLTLTIMSNKYNFMKDIMVNRQQKIQDTLTILMEAEIIPEEAAGEYKIRSLRTKLFIQPDMTYEQARIYYGDMIEIS